MKKFLTIFFTLAVFLFQGSFVEAAVRSEPDQTVRKPDLIIESRMTFDDLGRATLWVKNVGEARVTLPTVYVKGTWLRYDDTVIEEVTSFPLGGSAGDTIGIGESKRAALELPPADAFKIRARIDDSANPINESNKNNNSKTVDIPRPDFKIESINFNPENQRATIRVRHIGTAAANLDVGTATSFPHIEYYWKNSDKDSNGTRVGTLRLSRSLKLERGGPSLGVNEYFDFTQTDSIPAGARSLSAYLTYYDFIDDRDTANNSKTENLPLPDLIVKDVNFDPALGYAIPVIENKGTAIAKKGVYMINMRWIRQDGSYTGTAFGYQSDGVGDLAPGQKNPALTERLTNMQTNNYPPSDAVKVWAKVDGPNSVTESIEDNNEMTAEIPLRYPISALGNCTSKDDCKNYCNQPANAEACAEFGFEKGLLTKEEAEAAKEINEISETDPGPGNCTTKESCSEFCDKPENIDACLNYAEKNKWMSDYDLSKAKKVARAILDALIKTPGGCSTPDQCKTYCSNNTNAVECVSFGKSAGLLTAEEAAEAEKMAPLLEGGQMPGGGKTREEIEAYCEKKENREECGKFFEQAGVKKSGSGEGPNEDSERGTSETSPSIFKGESGGPGGCKTKTECDTYCDSHPGECDEQVRQAGGEVKEATVICSTREECSALCDNPAPENKEACKNVVIKEEPPESKGPTAGGESEEQIRENIRRIQENIAEMPSQSHECLKQKLGTEGYEKIMRGEIPTIPLTPEISQFCFAEGVRIRDAEAAQKPEGQEEKDAEVQKSQGLAPSILQSIQGIEVSFTSLLNNIWVRLVGAEF